MHYSIFYNLLTYKDNMIPKIIHQTWKDKKIPQEWKSSVNRCKKLHYGYKYILWTDKMMENFVKRVYPVIWPLYRSYKYHIQRCDVFRYLVLYHYGGIYLDLDTYCKKKLDGLLKHECVLTETPQGGLSNYFIMSTRKNKFMKYCIDHLEQYKDVGTLFGKHFHVMATSGPWFVTQMYRTYPTHLNDNKNKIHILSTNETSGDCNACNFDCKGGKYFTLVRGKSWHDLDSSVIDFIYCNYKKIIVFICVVLFTIIAIVKLL